VQELDEEPLEFLLDNEEDKATLFVHLEDFSITEPDEQNYGDKLMILSAFL